MANLDQQLTRSIALILNDVPAKAVLLAVPRNSGVPREAGRSLWTELNRLVHGSIELLDLIVVGAHGHWSAQADTDQ